MTAAIVALIPGLVFHYAFMSAYPEITDERLPTYYLFSEVASDLLLDAYVMVLFVLVAQTGVGVLQGFLERVDSIALSSLGIIALILTGYTILAASFIVVYAIPLLTRGMWLIFRPD